MQEQFSSPLSSCHRHLMLLSYVLTPAGVSVVTKFEVLSMGSSVNVECRGEASRMRDWVRSLVWRTQQIRGGKRKKKVLNRWFAGHKREIKERRCMNKANYFVSLL